MLTRRTPMQKPARKSPAGKQYEGRAPGRARIVAPSTGIVDAALALNAGMNAGEKRGGPDKSRSNAGREHMGRVAALGCIICRRLGYGATPAEVHHVREGQGGAQRAPDFLTIPLCPEHHRGATGLHGLGPRAFERRYDVDELGMLAETIRELTCSTGNR